MFTFIKEESITFPAGFLAAGINAGIKQGVNDLALVISEKACSSAAIYNGGLRNSAPMHISKDITDGHKPVKGILVNSGNGNLFTGEEGYEDALFIQGYLASRLGVNADSLLMSSSGVAGKKLPVTIMYAVSRICGKVSKAGGKEAAGAIISAGEKVKHYGMKVFLPQGKIRIGAMCSGKPEDKPDPSSISAYVTTDAEVDKDFLEQAIETAWETSFSEVYNLKSHAANDMSVILANGASKIKIEEGFAGDLFINALTALFRAMALDIILNDESFDPTELSNKESGKALKNLAESYVLKAAAYGYRSAKKKIAAELY